VVAGAVAPTGEENQGDIANIAFDGQGISIAEDPNVA
jgi:hypothetical protein